MPEYLLCDDCSKVSLAAVLFVLESLGVSVGVPTRSNEYDLHDETIILRGIFSLADVTSSAAI